MNSHHKTFLEPFFKEMNKTFPGRWCVLHSYETLPDFSESDVDMTFSSDDIAGLENVIFKIARLGNWVLYQKFWYDEPFAFYYVLKQESTETLLAIDFLIDNVGIGDYGFKSAFLTDHCDWYKEIIPIPNHETAFCYKIVKRVFKGRELSEDSNYLKEQYNQSDKNKIYRIFKEIYGNEGVKVLKYHFDQEDYSLTKKEVELLNRLKRRKLFNNFLFIRKKLWKGLRTLNRFMYPSGIILYVKDIDKKELYDFKMKLSEKTGILFRKIDLEIKKDPVSCWKALLTSTLIICNIEKNFQNKIIRSSWFTTDFPADIVELSSKTIDEKVDLYYELILESLRKRKKFKSILG